MNFAFLKTFFVRQAFVLGIGVVIVLAWLAPGVGTREGLLPVELLQTVGIFAIFLFQGLSLPFHELRRGASDWRLHVTVQATTFLFFPLVTWAGVTLSAGVLADPSLQAGFLFLSFLPTTIASSLAYTVAAKGNASGALFNTTLSNGAGIFLVPVFCLILVESSSPNEIDVQPVLGGILLKIILPLILGQIARFFLAEWAASHRTVMKRISSGVILFMIYSAFCDSFSREIWSGLNTGFLWWTVAGVCILLGGASLFAWFLSGRMRLDRPSRVTALLCGSQKTLAVGFPLAVMIFGSGTSGFELSLVIVPLLLYHPFQLVLDGMLIPRLRKYVESGP